MVRIPEYERRSELFTLTLTPREKILLARVSYEQGASMSGFLRKLIREAARKWEAEQGKVNRNHDANE